MGPKGKAFGRLFASLGNIKNSAPIAGETGATLTIGPDAEGPQRKGKSYLLTAGPNRRDFTGMIVCYAMHTETISECIDDALCLWGPADALAQTY